MFEKSINAFLQATSATLAEVAVGKNRGTISNTLDRAIKDAQALSEHLQPVRRRIPGTFKALAVLTNSLDGLLQAIQSKDVNVTKFRALVKAVQGFGLKKFFDQVEQDSGLVAQIDRDAGGPATQHRTPETEEGSEPEADVSRLASKFKVKTGTAVVKIKPGKVVRPKPLTADDIDMPTQIEKNDRLAVIDAEKKAKRDEAYREREEQAFQKLHEVEAKKPKLPRKLSGPFALARHPIVPLLKNEFNLDTLIGVLKQHRIEAVKAGSYLTLENQTLLAIDTDYLKTNKIKQTAEQYAEHVVTVLNKKASNKFGLMSLRARSNPVNPAIKLFWIMALNRIPARMKPGNIQDWDLLRARQVDDVEAELDRIQTAQKESEQLEQRRKAQLLEERKKHAEALTQLRTARGNLRK